MAVVTEWHAIQADISPTRINARNGVITCVHYEVFAFDEDNPNGYRGRAFGSIALPAPPAPPGLPFIAPDDAYPDILLSFAMPQLLASGTSIGPRLPITLSEPDPGYIVFQSDFERAEFEAIANYNALLNGE